MTEPIRPTLPFPCTFPIKAVGHAGADFDKIVAGIIARHVARFDPSAITRRMSRNGRYCALTVTIQAQDRAQLDALYQELTECPAVLHAL